MYLRGKIAVFIMMAVCLLSVNFTRELLKFPMLVKHYCDHKQEDKNTGFILFLVMHYSTEDGSDKDADEDGQLPFKSPGDVAGVSFVSVVPPAFMELSKPEREISRSFGGCNKLFLLSQYAAFVWQPPRC